VLGKLGIEGTLGILEVFELIIESIFGTEGIFGTIGIFIF
jgi:hypothetical protein